MITKNERYKKAIPEAIIHTSSELVSVAVLFSRDSILYAAVGNYMNPPPPQKKCQHAFRHHLQCCSNHIKTHKVNIVSDC